MDFLRGLAILLILPINVIGLAVSEYGAFWIDHGAARSLPDSIAFFLAHFLVQGKVYPILALMFGSGAFYTISRLRRDGRPVGIWGYRLGLLFLIGVLHNVLLFHGDILVDYAMAGVVILLCWRLPRRTMAWLAGVILLIPLISNLAWYHVHLSSQEVLAPSHVEAEYGFFYDFEEDDDWLDDPGYRQDLDDEPMGFVDMWLADARWRIDYRLGDISHFFANFFWQISGWMLIGYLLASVNVWGNPDRAREISRKWLPILIIAAPLLQGAHTLSRMDLIPSNMPEFLLVDYLAQIAMTALYLLLFLRLFPRVASAGFPVESIARAGRVTLSLYIGQSVVMTLLFAQYFLGLRVHYAMALFVWVPLLWMVCFVAWETWLRIFRHGPLEMLLIHLGAKGKPEG